MCRVFVTQPGCSARWKHQSLEALQKTGRVETGGRGGESHGHLLNKPAGGAIDGFSLEINASYRAATKQSLEERADDECDQDTI